MTQKEKLIELIDRFDDDRCKICGKHGISCENYECPPLADYLIDNGVVVLPCKVGDRVYIPKDGRIVGVRVQGISVSNSNQPILHFGGYPFEYAWGNELGRSIFLTREEAEAAPKGAET